MSRAHGVSICVCAQSPAPARRPPSFLLSPSHRPKTVGVDWSRRTAGVHRESHHQQESPVGVGATRPVMAESTPRHQRIHDPATAWLLRPRQVPPCARTARGGRAARRRVPGLVLQCGRRDGVGGHRPGPDRAVVPGARRGGAVAARSSLTRPAELPIGVWDPDTAPSRRRYPKARVGRCSVGAAAVPEARRTKTRVRRTIQWLS